MSASRRLGPCLAAAVAVCFTGGGIAAIPDDDPIWQDVSYYSTFDNPDLGLAPEKGTGSWNTTEGGDPAFITVSGASRALDIANYNGLTPEEGQKVLAQDEPCFTIAIRAKLGTQTDGLLFAFGSKATNGGLALRRGNAVGKFAVTADGDYERMSYQPPISSDTAYYTYFITYDASAASGNLKLYAADGAEPVASATASASSLTDVINLPFQWGWRHGETDDGGVGLRWEQKGNGAIDTLGVWKRQLTQEERTRLSREWNNQLAIAFEDVPEGWGEVPTHGLNRTADGTLELDLLVEARQTLGGRAANVAEIVGSSGTPSIYGITGNGQGDKSTLERDVWLKVSGGAYGTIVGGKENNWTSSHANTINGNLLTEVTGSSTRAKNVIGAIAAGGNGSNNGAFPFTGDSLVTIADGAQVSGAVVGGGTSQHRFTVQHNGDATVRIRSVQTSATTGDGIVSRADIVGGALPGASGNVGSGYVVNGDTRVEIEIPEASGSFGKHVLGASRVADNTTGNYTVNGDSTVVVDAPNVTFGSKILCAGGSGGTAHVTGTASLVLRAGTFTGNLIPCERGATVGDSALVIDGGERVIDLSKATLGAFNRLTLRGDVVLGDRRLPNAIVSQEVEGATAQVTLTEDEIAAGVVTLGRYEGESADFAALFAVTNPQEGWAFRLVGGRVEYGAPIGLAWETPAEGSDWAAGFAGFAAGADVRFGANEAGEPVTLPEVVSAGWVDVLGDYALSGAGALTAESVTVEPGATLTLGTGKAVRARYLRLTITDRTTGGEHNDGVALADLALTLGGVRLPWPAGTTITASQAQTNGSHHAEDILDGDLGTKWLWTTDTFSACTLTLDAGAGRSFAFDGYTLAMADQNGRNPRAWTLEMSADGADWKPLDTQDFDNETALAWTPSAWLGETLSVSAEPSEGPFVLGIPEPGRLDVFGTLAGQGLVLGDVRFYEGSVLVADGVSVPTLAGEAVGTVALRVEVEGETFLPVLHAAQAGIAFVAPEGYEVRHVDGTYWLVPALTEPFSATVSGEATWMEAGWADTAGVPVDAAQWPYLPIAERVVEVTAGAEGATLRTDPTVTQVGAFTVKPSEHTLTLAGDATLAPQALTVEGALAASPDTLTLPSGGEIAGTLTYDVSGSVALPALSGSGTLVKTGSGTLTLNDGTAVSPTIEVRGGTLALPSISEWGTVYGSIPNLIAAGEGRVYVSGWAGSITDTDATILLRDGGCLEFINGNAAFPPNWRPIAAPIVIENDGSAPASIRGSAYGGGTHLTGGISGHGTLVFEMGDSSSYDIRCAITEEGGTLKVRYADTNSTIYNLQAASYSGGTEVASRVDVRDPEVFGTGPVSIEAGGSLIIDTSANAENVLNVHAAYGNAGAVSGTVNLCEGASLTVGTAVFDKVTVAEGVVVPVAGLPEVPYDVQVVAWSEGPDSAERFEVEGVPEDCTLVVEADGLWVRAREVADVEWATPDAGGAWAEGLPGFRPVDNAIFGANSSAQVPVAIAGDTTAAAVTVAGDYAFTGTGTLTADTLTVEGSLTLPLGTPQSVRYVRLVPTARTTTGNNTNDGVALAEFQLLLDGVPVDWPEGTAITATKAQNTQNKHYAEDILDGDLTTKWYWTDAGATFNDCTLTIDVGEGNTVSFNGYRLAMADQNGRNPRTWAVEVSADGSLWTPVDAQDFTSEEANTWPTEAWMTQTFGAPAPLTVTVESGMAVSGTLAGGGRIVGDVAFAEGSTLKALPGTVLTIEGGVSGMCALDLSALDIPEETTRVAVLHAPEGLTPSAPEGFVAVYRDGTYYAVRQAAVGGAWTATLTADVDWNAAPWIDAAGRPIDSLILETMTWAQWQPLSVAITAGADVTLMDLPYVVTALTVEASEHTLTLGTLSESNPSPLFIPMALTVNGPLVATADNLTPMDGGAVTLNADLTYEVPAEDSFALLEGLSGTGRLIKTGPGTLNLAGATVSVDVRVEAGTLFNGGTIAGTLSLADGVILDCEIVDVKAATTVAVDEGATITVANLGTPTAERQLLAWENGPETADAFAGAPEGWAFAVREGGLWVIPEPSGPVLPTVAEGDEEGGVVFDANAVTVLSAAAEQAGLPEVTAVTGTANGKAMTTADINDALACLTGAGLVTVDGTALRVAYDLKVTAIERNDYGASVTVAVSGPNGTVGFVRGATVTPVAVNLADGSEEVLQTKAQIADDAQPSVEMVVLSDAPTFLFKVRVTPPAQ